MFLRFLVWLLCLPCLQAGEVAFREDFKEVPAHIPATSEDLTSDFLTLERLGPGADKLKLSFHPNIPNDPHYLWNGECRGPLLIAFPFKQTLDLSAKNWECRLNTKNFGKSTLHLALRVGGQWFAQKKSVAIAKDWNEQTLPLHKAEWFALNPKTVTFGKQAIEPDFTKAEAIGFAAPRTPNRSKDCIRLNWFELRRAKTKGEQSSLPKDGFIEPETPFLRSALVFQHEGEEHFVRRGVLVPLHYQNRWACFDPDTLRWVLVWEAPGGKQPITMDSMAAISFPDAKAKATRAPRPVGRILLAYPHNPLSKNKFSRDPRKARLINEDRKVGPANEETRWLGLSLSGKQVALFTGSQKSPRYQIAKSSENHLFELAIQTSHNRELLLHYRSEGKVETQNAEKRVLAPAQPIFPKSYTVSNSPPRQNGPFQVRNLRFPKLTRPIRATDIAFHSQGQAYLTTLDGDVWQISDSGKDQSQWIRVATGLFEPMAIEVSPEDEVFVLGRDQITKLLDLDKDGHFDTFWNASDAFQQTLHTRDYATSLSLAPDGSFLVAKGGIMSMGAKGLENELSGHRGTILRISPDGTKTEVLAEGLRLPYVGLRNDGAVFASDQQGNHIPSTPLHRIPTTSRKLPFLGFEPTNFQKSKSVTEPLLWYPYQANRSGAAFCTTSASAFPDLPETFLQVSWNGRLFAIETPESGQPFSWQLPLQLDFPALNGALHPQTGQLFVTGLGISGYKPTTKNLVGLASISQNQAFPAPVTLEVEENEITVTFNRPLTADESIIPGNPALRLFDVKRTPKYGSGHYLWDGKPGEHRFAARSFALSPDRTTFTASFDSLHRSELFDLQLMVSSKTQTYPLHLYTRPNHLTPASPRDLQKLAEAERDKPLLLPGDARQGQPLFTQYACIGCHSLEGQVLAGPPLNGIAKRMNREKVRESILNPAAEIAKGFEPAMPSFEGVIPPQDLEHLLTFLETLR